MLCRKLVALSLSLGRPFGLDEETRLMTADSQRFMVCSQGIGLSVCVCVHVSPNKLIRGRKPEFHFSALSLSDLSK